MSEIADLAEGEAFMNAVDDILGLNHPLRDAEIARLRQAWVAGRDYALAAATASGEAERLKAACDCADLLVRIVRPMYAGPSGDQGLNDPLYGECIRAINRYKQALADRAAGEREG